MTAGDERVWVLRNAHREHTGYQLPDGPSLGPGEEVRLAPESRALVAERRLTEATKDLERIAGVNRQLERAVEDVELDPCHPGTKIAQSVRGWAGDVALLAEVAALKAQGRMALDETPVQVRSLTGGEG